MTKRRALIGLCSVAAAAILIWSQIAVSDDGGTDGAKDFNPAHECDGCHGTQGPGGDPTYGTPEEIELLCLTCHGPGGVSVLKADVHMTSGGTQTCVDCHNPHYEPDNWLGGINLQNVGTVDYDNWPWIGRIQTPNSGLREVAFESRGTGVNEPSLHSFADSDEDENGYYDGICETCHTLTAYHRNSEPSGHFTGYTCTHCHLHEDGFAPSGGDCVACHAVEQGPRRAVVGEFPADDPHAHFGAELDNESCLVCHDLATHMNGYVELIDPDDGDMFYSFEQVSDLTSDPDLSNFCANCHDADGAARLDAPFDPFGDGNTPPDVAVRFSGTLQWNEWYGDDDCFGEEGTLRAVNSHHDLADADQAFSGAKLECINCHGAHNAGASQPVADPYETSSPWTGDDNGFCLSCHAGGSGPLVPGFPSGVAGPTVPLRGMDSCDYTGEPWYVFYTWTHAAHGQDSKRGWEGYSGAPSYELACQDCHDPHGSYSDANPQGNPYMIRDVVDGTMYVDDGVRAGGQWNGPPWETFGTVREVKVSIDGMVVDWGGDGSLCSTCHATWPAAYAWHDYCTNCQMCHGHGQAWGESDIHNWDDGTPCPLPPGPVALPPHHDPDAIREMASDDGR